MTHLEDGTIVAIRDGALVDGDAVAHLNACVPCRQSLESARVRSEVIARALSSLDVPYDLNRAKAAVRARLDEQREANRRPRRSLRTHFGRAAAVLLVATGAVYALPGSPVRGWLEGDRAPDAAAGLAPVEATPSATEASLEWTEVEVPLTDGRIRIVLTGASPGTEVELFWTEGASARIAAGPDARFAVGVGRAEVAVGLGPVRLEIPRFAALVSLEVNGRTFLRRDAGALEVLVPPAESSESGLRFTVTEP